MRERRRNSGATGKIGGISEHRCLGFIKHNFFFPLKS
ncbi:hypothetical protein CAEBREN_22962 [Caenorhabditis brenneri]|uniref:Uncharacterized protein n=1 Tax=Caenorhabditis brenneri TaxID=135651 RepID=G0PJZ6_CAEBE|nr:hypothetical protein CAEBREN_22962 [Caenorhabditis brenneri]